MAGDDGSVVSAQLFVRLSSVISLLFGLCLPFVPPFESVLYVRCVEGYPYKCPKLRIIPQEGLSEDDSGHLLSLLLDQVWPLLDKYMLRSHELFYVDVSFYRVSCNMILPFWCFSFSSLSTCVQLC